MSRSLRVWATTITVSWGLNSAKTIRPIIDLLRNFVETALWARMRVSLKGNLLQKVDVGTELCRGPCCSCCCGTRDRSGDVCPGRQHDSDTLLRTSFFLIVWIDSGGNSWDVLQWISHWIRACCSQWDISSLFTWLLPLIKQIAPQSITLSVSCTQIAQIGLKW